jgi:hypothetical protein
LCDLKAKALAALHRPQRLPHLVRSFFRRPKPLSHHRLNGPLQTFALGNRVPVGAWPDPARRVISIYERCFRCIITPGNVLA